MIKLMNLFLESIVKTYRLHRHIKFVKTKKQIPIDLHRYCPYLIPYHHNDDFQPYLEISNNLTLVPPERIWIIISLLKNSLSVEGEICEFGVYRGGTASAISLLLENLKSSKKLYLYDTFSGMPNLQTDLDWHDTSWFKDVNQEQVHETISRIRKNGEFFIIKGLLPDSFFSCHPNKISFAHIDVDLYESTFSCLEISYSRMQKGGFIVVDDYGEATCLGAREAVDRFFSDKPEFPLVLSNGQALVIKQ